jgi:hypothetical protein
VQETVRQVNRERAVAAVQVVNLAARLPALAGIAAAGAAVHHLSRQEAAAGAQPLVKRDRVALRVPEARVLARRSRERHDFTEAVAAGPVKEPIHRDPAEMVVGVQAARALRLAVPLLRTKAGAVVEVAIAVPAA